MSEEAEAAARYRQRAHRLRVIATEDVRPENRHLLNGLADDYDRMARALGQPKRSIPKA